MTKCPLKRGVCLRKVNNVVLYVTETMTKCPLKRGVCLKKVINVVFVCVWEHD